MKYSPDKYVLVNTFPTLPIYLTLISTIDVAVKAGSIVDILKVAPLVPSQACRGQGSNYLCSNS